MPQVEYSHWQYPGRSLTSVSEQRRSAPLRTVVGREGFEPSTLGLNVVGFLLRLLGFAYLVFCLVALSEDRDVE